MPEQILVVEGHSPARSEVTCDTGSLENRLLQHAQPRAASQCPCARVGKRVAQPREHRLEFTVENFLLSFSLPNFYFHAATAYDILRWKGARIGKRDYMGRLRLKA